MPTSGLTKSVAAARNSRYRLNQPAVSLCRRGHDTRSLSMDDSKICAYTLTHITERTAALSTSRRSRGQLAFRYNVLIAARDRWGNETPMTCRSIADHGFTGSAVPRAVERIASASSPAPGEQDSLSWQSSSVAVLATIVVTIGKAITATGIAILMSPRGRRRDQYHLIFRHVLYDHN